MLPVAAYLFPGFVFSRFLAELNAGGTWIPFERVSLMHWLTLTIGLGVFGLCQLQVRRFRQGQPSLLFGKRKRRKQTRRQEERETNVERKLIRRGLGYALLTVVLLAPHTLVRQNCLKDWSPSVAQVIALCYDGVESPRALARDPAALAELELDFGAIREPLYLEPGPPAGPHRGHVLVPLWFPTSERAQARLEAHRKRDATRHPLTSWIETEPAQLADTIRDEEAVRFAWTKLCFLFVHLAVVLAASAAYAFTYCSVEELFGILRAG